MKLDLKGRLLFLYVCSMQPYSTESFNWTLQPANPTSVTKGEDESLTWEFNLTADEQAKSQTFYLIKWKKFNQANSNYDQIAGQTFVSAFGTIVYNVPRAPHIEVDKNKNATLLINNVTTEDEGTYKIEYSLQPDGTVLADHEVNVTVLESPEVVVSDDQDVCEGSTVTLSCNATGKPTPNITWTKEEENGTDSGPLPSVKGFYVISTISRSSSGTYRCTASNGVGDPVNKTTKVIVGNSPSVDDVVISSNTADEGYHYNLSCEVSGVPVPSVSWIKVSNGERHAGKFLDFASISRNDTGNYTCEASNQCGKDSQTKAINVYFKPEIAQFQTSAVDHKVCQNDVISLNCAADAYPPVTSYQLLENDTAILYTNTSGMWTRNMSTRGVFTYKCMANSTYGTGKSRTIPIHVYVPPSIQEIDNQTITEGNNVTLTCQASGDPPLEVFWIKPDGQRAAKNVLMLPNITRNEIGEYRCEATNHCGNVSRTASVDVQYKPGSVLLQTNVSRNESCETIWVNFKCSSSDSNPPIHNYLLYNRTSLVDTDFQGQWIKEITPGHWLYNCGANQSLGITKSGNDISLTVFLPITIADMSNHSVIEGGNLPLKCDVNGSSPIVTWTHTKSGKINNGKYFNITNITIQDDGEYICEASNFCGPDRKGTYVNVKFKPRNVMLSYNETKVCNNSSIAFTCKAKGNPEVHSYQLHENDLNITDENRDGTWTKTMYHEGENRYSCVANNSVGHEESNTVIVTVVAPATIPDMKNNHSAVEGSNLTLECDVAGSSPFVTWTHTKSGKVNNGKTLVITNITIHDNGEYICEASNFCGPDRKGTYVNVEFKPRNVTLSIHQAKVCKNSSIAFTCKAKANPEVHSYRLYENDVNNVNNTDENQNGTWTKTMFLEGEYRYRCVANNSVGQGDSNTVSVTVVAPASIAKMSNHSVKEGKNLTLDCDVAGSSPTVTWTHINSGKVNNGKTWTFFNITRQDHGEYICEASNFCGPDREGTHVNVKSGGKITIQSSNCKEYVRRGVRFTIECPVEGNPRPNITWSVGGEILGHNKSNITIESQQIGEFIYTCAADNGIGEPDNSTFVYVVNVKVKKDHICMMKHNLEFSEDNLKRIAVREKLRNVIPKCQKHEVREVAPRPGSIIIYIHLSFEKPMGQEALTSMLQEAARQGRLGDNIDPDSITVVSDIPARHKCSDFYEDDQICKKVKTLWIAVIALVVLVVVVGIMIIIYMLHKRRKCRRKDQRVHSETDERQAFSSNHSTLSEANPYAEVNSGYAQSGPRPQGEIVTAQADGAVGAELPAEIVIGQEQRAVGGDAVSTYAAVDKSKKKDRKKDKKAAEQEPTEDQYAVVNKSKKKKKKKKKNEPDATYAEVDMSKKSQKKLKPGEVLYADLGEFHQMQKMPDVSTSPKTLSSIKRPDAYTETAYADITQFLKGSPQETSAEPPEDGTTSPGKTGDSAEASNETGF